MAHIQRHTYKSKRTGKPTTSYQARYSTPDGRERSRRFDRRVDAERWLDGHRADLSMGTWVDPEAGRIMLGDYANQWLDGRSDLRATTTAKYRGLLDRHIIPALGLTPISKVTPSQVRSWHAVLHRRRPATAASAYRLVQTIFHTAVDDELIVRTPCKVKGASTEHAAERPTATPHEVALAVAAAPQRYQVAILLAAWCQLRRGEVLGLQRRDFDLQVGLVTIERAWVQSEGGHMDVGLPKTDAGRRTITIPGHLLPVIEEHLQSVGPTADAWLFAGEKGVPVNPHSLGHAWTKARLAIGRPDLRFHDLRHSGLTWSASTGASVAEIMKRGGHASPTAALRYQHATMDRDRALAGALNDMAASAQAPAVISLVPEKAQTDKGRKKLAQGVEVETSITPLTRQYTEQSQRGSNPCSHLERVVS